MSSLNSLLTSDYSTTSSSAALSISNILSATYGASSSAIDVSAAVAAAIYSAREPERLMESEIVTLGTQMTDMSLIESATETLITDLQNMNLLSGALSSRTATSTNTSYLSATASNNAETGTHAVCINQLATKESWYSDSQESASSVLASSTITITLASGSTASFDTGSGTDGETLTELASSINSASLGISAKVVSDSSGSRLSIVSASTGKSYAFSVTASDYTGTSWTSQSLDSDATLGANTITITGSGDDVPSVSVTSSEGDTYEDMVDAINEAIDSYNTTATANGTSTLNVTATLVTDDDGNTSFTLTSTDDSDFTVNQPAFGLTEGSAGKNAEITIDGVPVSSTSNTVTDVIDGVTMYLNGAYSGAEFTLSISADSDAIASTVMQFVSDYNSVAELVYTQYEMIARTDSSGSSTTSLGSLASDPTLTNFQSTLQTILNYVSSSTYSSSSINLLSGLGVNVTNDGYLSVDTEMLSDIITASADAVQEFFEGEAFDGFAKNAYSSLSRYTSLTSGAFTIDLSSMSSQSSDLEERIEDFEANYISNQIVRLTAQYTSAEQALQSLSTTMDQINALLNSDD